MRISVDVTQEDIVDLQVGDAVDITFTAYPEDTYTGSILSINTTATSDYSNTVKLHCGDQRKVNWSSSTAV